VDEVITVPVERLRPLVEDWIARHETPQQAFLELEASSPYRADTWRKRLTDTVCVGRGGAWRGWWANSEIDFADVDELLTAAGLTHLWQTDLVDLLPELNPITEKGHASWQNAQLIHERHRRKLRVPEADLRKMHLLHRRKRLSIEAISRQLYRRYGYASEKAMSSAISAGWKVVGLTASDRGRDLRERRSRPHERPRSRRRARAPFDTS
jgi:hypothetical protein